METIYIDSIFFTNLAADYLLLLLTGRVCAEALARWRILTAAVLGAAYSAATFVPGLDWLSDGRIKLAAAAAMVMIAYGTEKSFFRCLAVFLAISAAFGGAVYAVSLVSGEGISDGTVVSVPLRVLILSFAVCYALLSAVFRRSAAKAAHKIMSVRAELCGRTAEFRALRDTGNSLYDPVTNRRVVVVSLDSLSGLFSEDAFKCLALPGAEALVRLSRLPEYTGRFRLIPYRAVGVKSGLLAAFMPDALSVDGEKISDALIAVSPTRLTDNGEYGGIL